MGDNGGTEELGEGADAPALARRRLLQGAAAAGVGAAAWSAPNIKTLGFTPAYAQVCTVPIQFFEVGNRNTACNCDPDAGTPGDKVANYKEIQNSCRPFNMFPASAILRNGSCAGTAVGDSGDCPPGYDSGDVGLCVGANGSGLFCVARVQVTEGQCGNVRDERFSAIFPPAGGFEFMPGVECQGGGNLFLQIDMVCSTDPFCLENL